MSLVSFTPVTDGSTATAAGVNTPLSTIYNDYNGNITNANIAANAAIAGSKVNLASVANPYKFLVYRSAAQTSAAGGNVILLCDTKVYDTGTNVDVATNKGRFTAPVTGFYRFSARTSGSATRILIFIAKNGTEVIRGNDLPSASPAGVVATGTISLAANDYVEAIIFTASSVALDVGQATTWFQGEFISAT